MLTQEVGSIFVYINERKKNLFSHYNKILKEVVSCCTRVKLETCIQSKVRDMHFLANGEKPLLILKLK